MYEKGDGPMDDDEMDQETARILALTDEEVLQEAAARGEDIELEVSKVRAIIELALINTKKHL